MTGLLTRAGSEVAKVYCWDRARRLVLALCRDPRCPDGDGYFAAELSEHEIAVTEASLLLILAAVADTVIASDGILSRAG